LEIPLSSPGPKPGFIHPFDTPTGGYGVAFQKAGIAGVFRTVPDRKAAIEHEIKKLADGRGQIVIGLNFVPARSFAPLLEPRLPLQADARRLHAGSKPRQADHGCG